MANPIAVITSNIPGLSDPTTVSRAAAAIDGIYKRLWADVYDLGTLAALRAGLLARNALYEGNAIAAIYRILASGHAAAREPHTASHLLAILAALLQDVPAAFAAEGYAHLIYDAMDEGELIIPDYAQLNAMRAQPLFVTLALHTMLDRPQRCDRDPHVSVGYINDLISMDGVDYITSTALQGLLKDSAFRAALYRGLRSNDEHKLFKCLQLLKRCVGGGPGMLGGFRSIHHEISPPWSLQQLLDLGAEEPLVTVCNTVARMVRKHSIERQLLGLLHTTLLDIIDLLCAGSETSSSSLAGAGQTAVNSSQISHVAAAAPAGASSSENSSPWPSSLITAHARLVLEVSKLVPVLVTCLCRMQPYAAQPAAAAALEALGAKPSMAALVAVLRAGDPTDWLMLQLQAEGYQVITSLVQNSPQLALAALAAGATRTIFSALVEWAAYLPVPANSDDLDPQNSTASNPDLEVEPFFDESRHGPAEQPAAAAAATLTTAATAGGGSTGRQQHSRLVEFLEQAAGSVPTQSVFEKQTSSANAGPPVSAAAAAALHLLRALLKAAAAAAAPSPVDSSSSSSRLQPSGAGVPAVSAVAETGSGIAASNPNSTITDMPEELPVLLLELWHVKVLQALATECLEQLQRLGVLTAAAASGDAGGAVCMKTLMGGHQDDRERSAGQGNHRASNAADQQQQQQQHTYGGVSAVQQVEDRMLQLKV